MPVALLAILFCGGTGAAETYRQWPFGIAPGGDGVRIVFEPASEGRVSSLTRVSVDDGRSKSTPDDYYEVPARPVGGYLGRVVVAATPDAKIEYPLELRLSFRPVLKTDLLPPPRGHSGEPESRLRWNRPMDLLNLDSPVRAERIRLSFEFDGGATNRTAAFPLILPSVAGEGSFGGRGQSLLSCLAEVVDREGRCLSRQQLVELFEASQESRGGSVSAWVMNDPEADRLLREQAGIEGLVTVDELPPYVQPYSEVGALWVSSREARSPVLSQTMLRRLMLMGVWIYGHGATVATLAEAVGLSGPSDVLLGGLRTLDGPSPQAARKSGDWRYAGKSLWESWYAPDASRHGEAHLPLENRRDLFAPRRGAFVGWTLGVLGVYVLLAGIGLPLAFWRLRGSQRLVLWWSVPAVAIVLATAGLLLGLILLPRHPACDVTEYRFAYGDWPEVYCQGVTRVLAFERRETALSLPAGAWKMPQAGYGGAGNRADYERTAHGEGEKGTTRRVGGPGRGEILTEEEACFRIVPRPLEIVGDGPARVKALAAVRNVHVWDEYRWRVLGDLAAGQTAEIASAAVTNEVAGMPGLIRGLFEPDGRAELAAAGVGPTMRPSFRPRPRAGGALISSWVVVALSDEKAGTQPTMADAQTESRVAWVIQVPRGSAPTVPQGEAKQP